MTPELIEVKIDKLVEGGQALGTLSDGKKVFVWNALPGETVRVRLIKHKHSYAEAIAEEIVVTSPERVEPLEANYLATSPWQILDFEAENRYKKQIVEDVYHQAGVGLPEFNIVSRGKVRPLMVFGNPPKDLHAGHVGEEDMPKIFIYRNKMEYSFWGDDDGLHLALHYRGSNGKQIVTGSKLAMTVIDDAANSVLNQLQKLAVRASDLKTIIVRCSQDHDVVVALYVKSATFPELTLPKDMQGLRVYHSNPKSPASVRTKLLQDLGDCTLHDTLLGKTYTYDVDSFFQVNVPMYERALERIKEHMSEPEIVDMYAGVGTIGLSVATQAVDLVELDPATAAMASINAADSGLNGSVIETSTEKALDYITHGKPVIFDPPRAGLHADVSARILEAKPPKIAYLSCNPVTQARDLAIIQDAYAIDHFEAYNFFPETPHIETLAILTRR